VDWYNITVFFHVIETEVIQGFSGLGLLNRKYNPKGGVQKSFLEQIHPPGHIYPASKR
jgi:hypothetical protein